MGHLVCPIKKQTPKQATKGKRLRGTVTKTQLITAARTSLAREIKNQSDGLKSKWKFFDTLNYMKEDVLRSLKAKEESEWTENETEQLIEYYKQNHILWNHSLSSVPQGQKLEGTELNKAFRAGRSHDDIKSRWNVLKPIFGIKKEEDSKVSGTGTDAVYTSQCCFKT